MASDEEWTVVHVINSVSLTGSVPLDRIEESKNLLHGLLSSSVNNSRDLKNCHNAYESVILMLREAMTAMEANDLLRARTLIVDWHLEYAVLRPIEEGEKDEQP